ncbi:MAG: M56 family metallopeptidase [Sphingobium sp.]|nr:M56 family metallopeptidase [Sphingobium sp.]
MTAILLMLGLKSLLVAAVTLGILRLARSRSAAERSTIAHLGLFALVALPLASLSLPTLSIALPEAVMPATVEPAAEPVAMPAEPLPQATTREAAAPSSAAPQISSAPAEKTALPLGHSPSLAEFAAPLARYAYALPAAALLFLTLVALIRLVSLRSRAQVMIDPHWLGALGRAQHRMGFKSGTALLTSTELSSPISWGLLRPTIVINENAMAAGEQAEAIIAHELAHVIQLDWAKLMLARIATAVFWFNPLAWVLAREAHQLREEAADDAVLAADIVGTDYAQLLVGFARHENHGLLLGAHGVAPGKDSLRRRVARVLDKTPARGPSGRSWVAGFTAGMMVMAAPLAAVTFGPARAKDDVADPVAQTETPAPAKSWSTRAGEAPNQVTTIEPRHLVSGRHSALEDAVEGLHDDGQSGWPIDAAAPQAPDKALIPGTAEFSAAWSRYGEALGNRIGRAFAARPAPTARPAPNAQPMPNFDFNFDFDFDFDSRNLPSFDSKNSGKRPSERDLDAMAGVPDGYRKEIADAGFPNATRGELAQAKALGLTADYISDLRKGGVTGPLRSFSQAQAVGLSGDYIQALRAAGVTGSVNDFIRARNMGVNAEYVDALRSAGINGSLGDYIQARAVGVSAGYVRALAAEGVNASLGDYQRMRAVGITSAYVRALHDHGTAITDPSRLIELKTRGYRPRDRNDDP